MFNFSYFYFLCVIILLYINMRKRIHFIGIGGIGISAVARYYKEKDYIVTGEDDNESENINILREMGIDVNTPISSVNLSAIPENELYKIIYTEAVDSQSPAILLAEEIVKRNNFELLTYPQALAEIISNKKLICIAGTHGKTTTTGLCYHALMNAGLNVSAIVGSLVDTDKGKTNYLTNDLNKSKEEYIIIEACEYKRHFLHYYPDYIIITNIDEDHLDYYKDINDIQDSFWEFINNINDKGSAFLHNCDFADIISNRFNILQKIQSLFASSIPFDNINGKLLHLYNSDKMSNNKIDLQIIGEHNRNNASLVLSLGKELGLSEKLLREGLYSYEGSWRRQEYKGKYRDIICYDDYAHTPIEIRETIRAFRESIAKDKNIILIFMPHLQSRTQLLLIDFVKYLSLADYLIIAPIYLARGESSEYRSMNNKVLAERVRTDIINKNRGEFVWTGEYDDDIKNTLDMIIDNTKNNNKENIIITMGAGPIDNIYKILK